VSTVNLPVSDEKHPVSTEILPETTVKYNL